MSGLPPYHSSPEAREIWEITGALAEEYSLRDMHERGIPICNHCFERDSDDFPWACPKYCPNRGHELQRIEWNAEEDFGIFINAQEIQSIGDKAQ